MEEAKGKYPLATANIKSPDSPLLLDLSGVSNYSAVLKAEQKLSDHISERSSNVITIEDSPASPELDHIELSGDRIIEDVITIEDTPESPTGNEESDIQFLGSHSVTRSMKVRVETGEQEDEGLGFVIDRDGLLPNPCFDPTKLSTSNTSPGSQHIRSQKPTEDTVPVYVVELQGVINLGSGSESEDERPGGLCRKMKKAKSGPKCFNCGGKHMISQCPEPRDSRRIYYNIKLFKKANASQGKNCRYHEDTDQKYSSLKPGLLSESLRSALGLSRSQLPKHIYNMRTYGYPPGWRDQAMQSTESTLKLYGTTVVYGRVGSHVISPSQVHCYPGFNTAVPHGFQDECRLLCKPPLSQRQRREKFIEELTAEFERKKMEKNRQMDKRYLQAFTKRTWESTEEISQRPPKRRDESDRLQSSLDKSKRRRLSSEHSSAERKRDSHGNQRDRSRDRDGDDRGSSSRHRGSTRDDCRERSPVRKQSSSRAGCSSSYTDVGNRRESSHSRGDSYRRSTTLHSSSERRRCDKQRFNSGSSGEGRRNLSHSSSRSRGLRDEENGKPHSRRGRLDNECRRRGERMSRERDRRGERKSRDSHRRNERSEKSKPSRRPERVCDERRTQSADTRAVTQDTFNLKGTLAPKWNDSPLPKNPGSMLGLEYRNKLASKRPNHRPIISEKEKEAILATFTRRTRPRSPSLLENCSVGTGPFSTTSDDVVLLAPSPVRSSPTLDPDVLMRRNIFRQLWNSQHNEMWEVLSDPGECLYIDTDYSDSEDEVVILGEGAALTGIIKVKEDDRNANTNAEDLTEIETKFECDSTSDVLILEEESKNQLLSTPIIDVDEAGSSESVEDISSSEDQLPSGRHQHLPQLPDVYIYKNLYQELPSLDKFAVGMTDLLLHETDEENVGRFDKVLALLSKRKVK